MDRATSKYQWISCDGGPLMVLEERLLPFWEGSDEPSGGRVVEAKSRWGLDVATDYDRACDVEDYIAAIPVSEGDALVLGGDDTAATWIPPEGDRDGILVRWIFADDELDLVETAKNLSQDRLMEQEVEFDLNKSPLVLFAATESGLTPIYPRLTFDLRVGSYVVSTVEKTEDRTSLICHRFRRID